MAVPIDPLALLDAAINDLTTTAAFFRGPTRHFANKTAIRASCISIVNVTEKVHNDKFAGHPSRLLVDVAVILEDRQLVQN